MSTGDDQRERPTVSVVIPVYNDARGLQACLEGLEAQTYPGEELEIIVVDNGSNDHPETVVSRFERVRLLVETSPGSYAARNRGVSESRGDLIAFTDADCVPARAWLERGVGRLIEDPEVGLVGGRIDVYPIDPDRPTGVELADMIVSFQQERFVEELQFAATASAFTRNDVFERVGPFDQALMSGGDRDWGGRVAKAGYRIVYEDTAAVSHPARRSLRQLYQRSKRLHAGARDRRRSAGSRFPVGQFLRNLVPPLGTARRLYEDERVPGPWSWARLVGVLTAMRLMRAWLTLRFALGGGSPRQ